MSCTRSRVRRRFVRLVAAASLRGSLVQLRQTNAFRVATSAPQHRARLLKTLAGEVEHAPQFRPLEQQPAVHVVSFGGSSWSRGGTAAAVVVVVAAPNATSGRRDAAVVGRDRASRQRIGYRVTALAVVARGTVDGIQRGQFALQFRDPLPLTVQRRLIDNGPAFFGRRFDVSVTGALP